MKKNTYLFIALILSIMPINHLIYANTQVIESNYLVTEDLRFFLEKVIGMKADRYSQNFQIENIFGIKQEGKTAVIYYEYSYYNSSKYNRGTRNVKDETIIVKLNSGKWFYPHEKMFVVKLLPVNKNDEKKILKLFEAYKTLFTRKTNLTKDILNQLIHYHDNQLSTDLDLQRINNDIKEKVDEIFLKEIIPLEDENRAMIHVEIINNGEKDSRNETICKVKDNWFLGCYAEHTFPNLTETIAADLLKIMNDAFNNTSYEKLKDIYKPDGKQLSERDWESFTKGLRIYLKKSGKILNFKIVKSTIHGDTGVFNIVTTYEKSGIQKETMVILRSGYDFYISKLE